MQYRIKKTVRVTYFDIVEAKNKKEATTAAYKLHTNPDVKIKVSVLKWTTPAEVCSTKEV